MKNHQYDAIIIGGGHNGLVTAAYLAKAGKKVAVLERRDTLGGAAATEEIWPGFKVNTGAADAGLLRPEIIAELGLRGHGLEFIESEVAALALQPDGSPLTLWRDPRQTVAEIARFSPADAAKFPAFMRLMTTLTGVLDQIMTLTPPSLEEIKPGELIPWAKLGLKLKGLGAKEMMEFLRVLPMTTNEFLDEWFESDALKGALGAASISGLMQGPQSSGTAFVMLYNYLGAAASGGFKASRFVRGGIGQLAAALGRAARQYKADIFTGAEVARILLTEDPHTGEQRASGVVMASGEEIRAKVVISNADPNRTFFGLVGAPNLEPHFVRRVKNIRYRGCVAKVNLALSGLPNFSLPSFPGRGQGEGLGGHLLVSPSLEYLERAYDDAKYGRFSAQPYLDVVIPSVLDSLLAPAGQHVMTITMQYAPYKLRGGRGAEEQGSGGDKNQKNELHPSNWDETQRQVLGDKIIDTLAQYAPNLKDLIRHCQVITPADWERDYGLTEGNINHGEMMLDQLLFMRPVAGYGQYRSPIEGLYLCGAGAHPGGGVTGAPGYNAAREVLRELK
ncbi:MAG: NAD(P)/FAD-dependent oxidoreductase [Anaerolineae bacterium]